MKASSRLAEPRFSGPRIDGTGFMVDVWDERPLTPTEAEALLSPAAALAGAMLTSTPHIALSRVTVDRDGLWVSVEVRGHTSYDADTTLFARAWFDDVWDAVHLGAHPDAVHLKSAPRLLALARANRTMDWNSAIVWAGMTPADAPRATGS